MSIHVTKDLTIEIVQHDMMANFQYLLLRRGREVRPKGREREQSWLNALGLSRLVDKLRKEES